MYFACTQLAILWSAGRHEVGTGWMALTQAGLPWVLGTSLYTGIHTPCCCNRFVLVVLVGFIHFTFTFALAGPILAAVFLIWQGHTVTAGWLLLLALPGFMKLAQRPTPRRLPQSDITLDIGYGWIDCLGDIIWAGSPVILAVIILGAFLYWQLILAEGAYMGRHIVALLYNWSANIYDRIKQFNTGYEQWFLARPLTNALFSFPNPIILDVATGTARLGRTLFPEVSFRGNIVGLDFSRKMLVQAEAKTRIWADRVNFIWQDASELPFPDNTFETVTCLEALEFMPDPDQVLAEMVRVLRPGGIFLTTNRIGKDTSGSPAHPESGKIRIQTPESFA